MPPEPKPASCGPPRAPTRWWRGSSISSATSATPGPPEPEVPLRVPRLPDSMVLRHPQFDPVALQLGPIAIHWYGLTYLVAFGLFVWLGTLRTKQPQYAQRGWQRRDIEDLLFYGVLGVVIGGRLGYVVFYK